MTDVVRNAIIVAQCDGNQSRVLMVEEHLEAIQKEEAPTQWLFIHAPRFDGMPKLGSG